MLAILSLFWSLSVEAKPVPPSPQRYVWDEANVVPDDAERQIALLLADHAKATDEQIVVAVFQSLEGEDLVDYTHRVFQEWKIGKRGKDNGVLLALYWDDRKSRIEVGYGLEPLLTDAKSKRILTEDLAPWLKQGQPAEALKQATREILVTLESPLVAAGQIEKRVAPQGRQRLGLSGTLAVFLMIVFMVFLRVLHAVVSAPVHITHGGVFGPRTWYRGTRRGALGGLGGFGGGGFGGGGFGGFGGGGGRSGGGGASGSW